MKELGRGPYGIPKAKVVRPFLALAEFVSTLALAKALRSHEQLSPARPLASVEPARDEDTVAQSTSM